MNEYTFFSQELWSRFGVSILHQALAHEPTLRVNPRYIECMIKYKTLHENEHKGEKYSLQNQRNG